MKSVSLIVPLVTVSVAAGSAPEQELNEGFSAFSAENMNTQGTQSNTAGIAATMPMELAQSSNEAFGDTNEHHKEFEVRKYDWIKKIIEQYTTRSDDVNSYMELLDLISLIENLHTSLSQTHNK